MTRSARSDAGTQNSRVGLGGIPALVWLHDLGRRGGPERELIGDRLGSFLREGKLLTESPQGLRERRT
jgi:hypothetical protein